MDIYIVSYQEKDGTTLREELNLGYTVRYSGYDKDLFTIDNDGVLTAGEQFGESKIR